MSHKLLDPRPPLVAQSLLTQLWLRGGAYETLWNPEALCELQTGQKRSFFPLSVITRKKKKTNKHDITNTAVSFLERTQPFFAMYVKEH